MKDLDGVQSKENDVKVVQTIIFTFLVDFISCLFLPLIPTNTQILDPSLNIVRLFEGLEIPK